MHVDECRQSVSTRKQKIMLATTFLLCEAIRMRSMTVKRAGSMGGLTRAKNLSPEQRVKAARKAAKVRWENYAKRQVAEPVPNGQ